MKRGDRLGAHGDRYCTGSHDTIELPELTTGTRPLLSSWVLEANVYFKVLGEDPPGGVERPEMYPVLTIIVVSRFPYTFSLVYGSFLEFIKCSVSSKVDPVFGTSGFVYHL